MRNDLGERGGAAVVEVRSVLPQGTKRCRAVPLICRACRVCAIDASVRRRVSCSAVVIRAGPADVAARARPIKNRASSLGDGCIEATGRRRRRREAVLVGAQRRPTSGVCFPSWLYRGSYLPGPHEVYTAF